MLKVTDTNVEVRLVGRPKDDSIFVHLNRVRMCYPEQGDQVWSGRVCRSRKAKRNRSSDVTSYVDQYTGPMNILVQ